MSDYLVMKSNALLRSLKRLATQRGWSFSERAGKGSHLIVRLNGKMTVIPMHGADLKPGLFRGILKQLGITERDLED
jgi:predicted RNA binding protein YcfA (HicA-like mRNA interferase family)